MGRLSFKRSVFAGRDRSNRHQARNGHPHPPCSTSSGGSIAKARRLLCEPAWYTNTISVKSLYDTINGTRIALFLIKRGHKQLGGMLCGLGLARG